MTRVVMHGTASWHIDDPWAGRHVVMVDDAASTAAALDLARATCHCGYTFPNVVNYRPGRIIATGTPTK
jgi:hypothetical protein